MIKTIPGAEITYYTLFWQSKTRIYSDEKYYIIKNTLKMHQNMSKKGYKMIKTIPGAETMCYTLLRWSKTSAHSYEIYYITKNM